MSLHFEEGHTADSVVCSPTRFTAECGSIQCEREKHFPCTSGYCDWLTKPADKKVIRAIQDNKPGPRHVYKCVCVLSAISSNYCWSFGWGGMGAGGGSARTLCNYGGRGSEWRNIDGKVMKSMNCMVMSMVLLVCQQTSVGRETNKYLQIVSIWSHFCEILDLSITALVPYCPSRS